MAGACGDFGEELVVERFDGAGARWVKKYVGGGFMARATWWFRKSLRPACLVMVRGRRGCTGFG